MRLFYVLRQANNHQTKSILSAIVGETNVSNGKSVLKFVYCEKATNLKKIFHLILTVVLSKVKTKQKIFQLFVAFSENLNFSM